ncbi:DUF1800 family protein [uncultured Pseudoteredinibacter sp.]|uniref:DUF1800 family protein n=1 Tax=uncultured Pseudoteredinibacter sp. TaxID=1641701 RepID=UPI002613C73B|nr:DUF1800 family protein [uncultured Pseudoteredinibacter sp.]
MNSLLETSRFLMQATLGYDQALLQQVSTDGISNWLGTQLNAPALANDHYQSSTNSIWQDFRSQCLAKAANDESKLNGDNNNPCLPYKWYFRMAWWQRCIENNNSDILRRRVAQALSEILVLSDNSALELDAVGLGSYYDLLYKHAFGNYKELLFDVSMHPCMGVYLTHMNNRKKEANIHPDENYAREILQLFTIGLFELNPDGSRKQLAGKDIPTYDNDDIKELARVFTGIKAANYEYEWTTPFWDKAALNGTSVSFVDSVSKSYKTVPYVNMVDPMEVDEAFHDRGAKSLLDGYLQLPANVNGAVEIRSAVDKLVEHPNTRVFVAKKLIQQLVTSNPSGAYIQHVANAFGSDGDLKATVEAVLTYPLTNTVAAQRFPSAYSQGAKEVQAQKLKSPSLRLSQILLAFSADNTSKKYWMTAEDTLFSLRHNPLSSPTVFNFYKPDYVPHGALEQLDLVAPEFELHDSATSIAYVNVLYDWLFAGALASVSTEVSRENNIFNIPELDEVKLFDKLDNRLNLNLSAYAARANSPANHDALIEEVGILLTAKSNLPVKPHILNAISTYQTNGEWVMQTIVFMIAASPEFTVMEA